MVVAVTIAIKKRPKFNKALWFDGLRDHPRFRALRAKMGLP